MIRGIHVAIADKDIQEAYVFLQDKLGLASYDAGGGFLIFTPDEVEMAVEPPSGDAPFDVSFFCDDLDATIQELERQGVPCVTPVREEVWGRVSGFDLPSGRSVILYQRKYGKGKPVG